MASIDQTVKYYLNDFPKSLFPLDTNKIIIEEVPSIINNSIYQNILDKNNKEFSFMPQIKCHASKHGLHLRRTFKLDPIAEFYIYDLVSRNKGTFRKDHSPHRLTFGHKFVNGEPASLTVEYRKFKINVAKFRGEYKHALKLDISAYFNSIYHHDIVKWFDDGRSQNDVEGLGQFLREINSGRSVDCLPQGIHPCKVIGSEFLKFIDNNRFLKSDIILRFMDDFFLFSDSEEKLRHDFTLIQQLAGEKGLNFNSAKTKFDEDAFSNVDSKLEKIRRELIIYQYEYIETYDGQEEIEYEDVLTLNHDQTEYLYSLLHNPELDELDAELILTFLGGNGNDILDYLEVFFERFPNLSKRVFHFCKNINDKSSLANVIKKLLNNGQMITEEQLFWIAKISEEYLKKTSDYSDILIGLIEHKSSTDITKSKVLEMPEQRFGLDDMRDNYIRVGHSGWLAWSSAVGTRGMSKIKRNHVLKYFGNGSSVNYIIANAIMRLK